MRLAAGCPQGFQTRQLSLQLLFKRIQGEPLSPPEKAQAVHAFFVKYEKILAPEISQLSLL